MLRSLDSALITALLAVASTALADVYYVAKTGDDAHTCIEAKNVGTSKLTIKAALSCVGTTPGAGAGHSVVVKEGTYAEAIVSNIPTGTSWDAPFTLTASPGEVVTLKPVDIRALYLSGVEYFVFSGFRIDGTTSSSEAVKIDCDARVVPPRCSHHIRLQNLDIFDIYNNGILSPPGATDNEFINVKIRGCGLRNLAADLGGRSGISIGGDSNLVEGCEIRDCSFGGIILYDVNGSPSQNIVRNNFVSDITAVRGNGARPDHVGIGVYRGSKNLIYNNVVTNVVGSGITVSSGASDSRVFHNTVVEVKSGRGINLSAGVMNTTLSNNIVWLAGTGPILNAGSGTMLGNNLCTDATVCEVTSPPGFLDEATRDFRLGPNSPALDVGKSIPEGANDLLGVRRPQGPGYDLGAYEREVSTDAGSGGKYRVFAQGCGCGSALPLLPIGAMLTVVLHFLPSRGRRKRRDGSPD